MSVDIYTLKRKYDEFENLDFWTLKKIAELINKARNQMPEDEDETISDLRNEVEDLEEQRDELQEEADNLRELLNEKNEELRELKDKLENQYNKGYTTGYQDGAESDIL